MTNNEIVKKMKNAIKEKTKDIVKNKNMRPMTNEDAEELVNKIYVANKKEPEVEGQIKIIYKEVW